ncbi:MAG: hypothetical protein ACPGNV_09315 [Mangrovicoccus sp.]
MTTVESTLPATPLWQRILFMVPVIGWVMRDVLTKDESNVYWALGLLVSAWAVAILLFGYPGLIIPALALVPTMFLVLILITRG